VDKHIRIAGNWEMYCKFQRLREELEIFEEFIQ
jgi:hypothetical protein